MKPRLLLLLLTFNTLIVSASRVDTLMVASASMNKSIPNLVILPDHYSAEQESYPVLYLLHGAGGTYADWVSKVPKLKAYADTYNLIIVCPDGGLTSWYFDSPMDVKMKYETYISKELINAIDTTYNTTAEKSGRAITGLSMGGHGAFYLAFKHQDIWGAAGSMSGGLDIRPFPNNWDLNKRLGNYAEYKDNWEENTVINMVYKLTDNSLKLIFDCGISDFFYDANKRLHEKLMERNIAHDYIERPGNHNWAYWSNSIQYQLLFFNDYFKQ
ncbi:alpha/beta hydrolase [Gelidibacter salicanalis]|uniref:Esterase family protein n=1 Tax=Gelidibacter salicanalis TaxID=291193 RepID=A0A934KRC9_9FLAO|nr:alpha/beta hydrolase family protein [Gelidibacter salicanalis]MBJ7880031.1 esterase family protein [Gelidibacter salicanalis]